jgi:hypothetical protein
LVRVDGIKDNDLWEHTCERELQWTARVNPRERLIEQVVAGEPYVCYKVCAGIVIASPTGESLFQIVHQWVCIIDSMISLHCRDREEKERKAPPGSHLWLENGVGVRESAPDKPGVVAPLLWI